MHRGSHHPIYPPIEPKAQPRILVLLAREDCSCKLPSPVPRWGGCKRNTGKKKKEEHREGEVNILFDLMNLN